jgi:heme-degrading monooxygenase HmoA
MPHTLLSFFYQSLINMIAVIFEVEPSPDEHQTYLDHAARLRPLLEQLDGFISIERFQSLSTPGKLVSLSFWRDEASVRTWREHEEHRRTQVVGRAGVFLDYRLRVADVIRDYGMYEREQAPQFHPLVERTTSGSG